MAPPVSRDVIFKLPSVAVAGITIEGMEVLVQVEAPEVNIAANKTYLIIDIKHCGTRSRAGLAQMVARDCNSSPLPPLRLTGVVEIILGRILNAFPP